MPHVLTDNPSLPPFSALRAFEAVGRLQGIRRAAKVLNLDHAVVSRHVRALEEWAGVRLINRLKGSVALTDEGANYHSNISRALADIAEATAKLIGSTNDRRLSIWCVPGFASQWLASRLDSFQNDNPEFELELRPTERSPDFNSYEADVDIRYLAGPMAVSASMIRGGLRQFEIARPPVVAVANPTCAASLPPIHCPADMLNVPLLHEESEQQWRDWFSAQGVAVPGPLRGPRLWHAHVAIEAARRGRGVAIANPFLIGDDLSAGRLVDLSRPTSGDSPISLGAYVFAARADRWQSPAVSRFRRWLKTSTACVKPEPVRALNYRIDAAAEAM